jgi:osmotically-inducible protein OsmY
VRRDRYATLLALIAALHLQGCIALIGAGGAAAYSTLEDRRTTGTQIEDEGIEVRAASRIDERLRERAHVNVTAYNRAVLVTGEAWDEATRTEIEQIVAAVPNVRGITNEVEVAGLSSLASRANDSSLTLKVRSRLLNAKQFNPVHIKVVTEAGVVYLMGIVTEKEAEAATEIARTTGGVRKVVKVFEYCKSTDEPCRPAAVTKPPAKPAA